MTILGSFKNVTGEIRSKFVAQLTGAKLLDIGCGNGETTKTFCTNGNCVIGIDVRNRVSSATRESFQFILADATHLPFKDKCFDVAVSFDVIEHIIDDRTVLREAFRVLKKKGTLFIETPNAARLSQRLSRLLTGRLPTYPRYYSSDVIHVREYTIKEFIPLIERAGFIVEKLTGGWLGLAGRVDIGVTIFPKSLISWAQAFILFAKKR